MSPRVKMLILLVFIVSSIMSNNLFAKQPEISPLQRLRINAERIDQAIVTRSTEIALREAIRLKRQVRGLVSGPDDYRYLAAIARIALINADLNDLKNADRGSAYAVGWIVKAKKTASRTDPDRAFLSAYIWLSRAYVLVQIGRYGDAAEIYKKIFAKEEFYEALATRVEAGPSLPGKIFFNPNRGQILSFGVTDLIFRHWSALFQLALSDSKYEQIELDAFSRVSQIILPKFQARMASNPSGAAGLGIFQALQTGIRTAAPQEFFQELIPALAGKLLKIDNSPPFLRSPIVPDMFLYGAKRLRLAGHCRRADKPYQAALKIAAQTQGPFGRTALKIKTDQGLCLLQAKKYLAAYRLFTEAIEGFAQSALRDAVQVNYQRRHLAERKVVDVAAFGAVLGAWQLFQRSSDRSLVAQSFRAAQIHGRTSAGFALALASKRHLSGKSSASELIRKAQDLSQKWTILERRLTRALMNPQTANSDATLISNELVMTNGQIAAVKAELVKKHPEFQHLIDIDTLGIRQVQKLLSPAEALVKFLIQRPGDFNAEKSFIWVVTKKEARWISIDRNWPWFKDAVDRLRCGLDASTAVEPRCLKLPRINNKGSSIGRLPPFDAQHAHKLYLELFGQVEAMIRGKRLFLVTAGALDQLPFHTLVTRSPKPGTPHKNIQWMARHNAITVLPSVLTLKALRRRFQASQGTKPFIGFGNPVLEGPHKGYAKLALAARTRRHCGKTVRGKLSQHLLPRGVAPLSNPASIRQQVPLPETADELCQVAADIGATMNSVYLAGRAREAAIKDLSAKGQLANYRILHFATHAAMAGELNPSAEPGLIMSPPDKASALDDGYLTASEIARLRLDADFIVLSACNTAAGKSSETEALSGLAQAFFYAGARSLLVSHWYVDSKATVALITGAFREQKLTPGISWAQALRRAMLSLIAAGGRNAHPANWAPFMLVGNSRPDS